MAAGSSAPELATSTIGLFLAKDDIGVSGVVGSAVFNITLVSGAELGLRTMGRMGLIYGHRRDLQSSARLVFSSTLHQHDCILLFNAKTRHRGRQIRLRRFNKQ